MDIYRWLRHQWDRTLAVLFGFGALVALLLGWLGVSRVSLPAEQIPYLASGGLLGLFALGAAATLWLSADLRDLWRKLDDIHHDLAAEAEDEEPSAPARRRPTLLGAQPEPESRQGRVALPTAAP